VDVLDEENEEENLQQHLLQIREQFCNWQKEIEKMKQ